MSDDDDYGSEEEEEVQDLSNDIVVTKYKLAAEITNRVLGEVIKLCVPGAKIVEVCEKGDEMLAKETAAVYNKKNDKGEKVEKGIAFPTCVSVNNCVCHYSPSAKDDAAELAAGDLAKVDLGCHIDGFIAVAAHTVQVGAEGGKVTGRAADVVSAASVASDAAMRLFKEGHNNNEVMEVLETVAEAYDCRVVQGVLSHQMKRFVIDGNKVVLSKSGEDYRAEESPFEKYEVYALDVVMSTGEGKPKLMDEKQTSVYKRALDKNYQLKLKAARNVFAEINTKFPALPFTVRALEGEGNRTKLGLVECVDHELLTPYPVLYEKEGDLVAHFKSTVLIMGSGLDKATGAPLQELATDKKCDDEGIQALLATELKKAKKKKAKK